MELVNVEGESADFEKLSVKYTLKIEVLNRTDINTVTKQ